jgi:hypothetical protein
MSAGYGGWKPKRIRHSIAYSLRTAQDHAIDSSHSPDWPATLYRAVAFLLFKSAYDIVHLSGNVSALRIRV